MKRFFDAIRKRYKVNHTESPEVDWETTHKNNMHQVMISQALLGVISPNFREIFVKFTEPCWKMTFVLEQPNAQDREEIEDFKTELDALLGKNQKYDVIIEISNMQRCYRQGCHYLYRRRETARYTYWVSRLILKDGTLLTEKIMPHDQNIIPDAFLEIGSELNLKHEDRDLRVRVVHWSIRFEDFPINPNMIHIRVQEI